MITRLYVKKYTVKEWGKFDTFKQEILCKKYQVILTDHKTKREKLAGVLSHINAKNVNKSIDKFQDITNKMDKGFKEWDKQKQKIGSKDYSFITGK